MTSSFNSHPQVGDTAPDLPVQAGDGSSVQLATLWRDQPVLLVFTRHFG